MTPQAYETLYRWDWFRREQWRGGFRQVKRLSPSGFARIMADRPGQWVLDCSCGLGLKTIVMADLGLRVCGSDQCGFAVEKARELAAMEGRKIEYFISPWQELAVRAPRRFAGVFCDALSWIASDDEFLASIAGIREVLLPGGRLVFMGAQQDSPSDDASQRRLFDELTRDLPATTLGWRHEHDGLRCAQTILREKGDMYVDEHHVFVVEQGDEVHVEKATIRQPFSWHWQRLSEMFQRAGYARLETRTLEDLTGPAGPLKLNVATRG